CPLVSPSRPAPAACNNAACPCSPPSCWPPRKRRRCWPPVAPNNRPGVWATTVSRSRNNPWCRRSMPSPRSPAGRSACPPSSARPWPHPACRSTAAGNSFGTPAGRHQP
ncbi:TonB-dependent hemin, ferrichrome receptor @ Iron siderophore receptor protein, partial [Pseudomonas sp. FEN]